MTGADQPPPGLTPTQAMRWRTAARVLAQAEQTDINALDRGNRTLLTGRLRHALADMMTLLHEACANENAPGGR